MKTKQAKERKILRHRFLDRDTIPGVFLLTLGALIGGQILIGNLLGLLISFFGGVASALLGYDASAKAAVESIALAGVNLALVFVAFLLLSLYWRLFWPEYRGSLPGENLRFWMLFALALSAIVLVAQLITFRASNTPFGLPPVVNLCAALMAGCFEESVYRGLAGSYLMRQWPGEKGVLRTIFVTAVVFGLVHATNMLGCAPLGITVLQILNACGMGVFLCALFLRCGSLWPGMLFHVLFDAIAFMDTSSIDAGGGYNSDVTVGLADSVPAFILIVVTVFLGLFLVRPAVRGEVARLWEQKWTPPAAQQDPPDA